MAFFRPNIVTYIASLKWYEIVSQISPQNATQRLQHGDGWATPVSYHITTRLRKVDENVDAAKFESLSSAFPHLGFGVWAALFVWGGRVSIRGRPCESFPRI